MLSRLSIARLFQKSVRNMASSEAFTYQDVKESMKREDSIIIDVREPQELIDDGKIPGSVNIPVGSIESAFLSANTKQFREKYGAEKPGIDTEIILSCKSGRRSEVATQILQRIGFRNVYNYEGGWLDWKKHMSEKKPED